jgi:hypothetical protein
MVSSDPVGTGLPTGPQGRHLWDRWPHRSPAAGCVGPVSPPVFSSRISGTGATLLWDRSPDRSSRAGSVGPASPPGFSSRISGTGATLLWDRSPDRSSRAGSVGPVSPPISGSRKLEFENDYMSRRVRRRVFTHDGTAWGTTPTSDTGPRAIGARPSAGSPPFSRPRSNMARGEAAVRVAVAVGAACGSPRMERIQARDRDSSGDLPTTIVTRGLRSGLG